MLVCSDGEPDAATASAVTSYYEVRWRIEEFFRLLKSGARPEERHLLDLESIRKAIALDAVTACQVFALRDAARNEPDLPAAEVLDNDELDCLAQLVVYHSLLPRSQSGRPTRARPSS